MIDYMTTKVTASSDKAWVGDFPPSVQDTSNMVVGCTTWQNYWPYIYPTVPSVPTYITYEVPNKLETAFKIAGHLLEAKLIREMVVADFIALVNKIAGII